MKNVEDIMMRTTPGKADNSLTGTILNILQAWLLSLCKAQTSLDWGFINNAATVCDLMQWSEKHCEGNDKSLNSFRKLWYNYRDTQKQKKMCFNLWLQYNAGSHHMVRSQTKQCVRSEMSAAWRKAGSLLQGLSLCPHKHCVPAVYLCPGLVVKRAG